MHNCPKHLSFDYYSVSNVMTFLLTRGYPKCLHQERTRVYIQCMYLSRKYEWGIHRSTWGNFILKIKKKTIMDRNS